MSQNAYGQPNRFPLLPKIIDGGVAGVVGVSIVFPIDLVKTRLQNQQVLADGTRMYKNFLDAGVKTVRADGFRGLYRGLGVNALFITPEKAIKLVVNDFLRYRFKDQNGYVSPLYAMLAGGGAGLCQITVTTPMELLKIQQQDQSRSGSQKVSSLQIIQRHGIATIFRGFQPTAMRDIPFSAIYFPLYAIIQAKIKSNLTKGEDPRKSGKSLESMASLQAGIIAASIASFSVNPCDVVKTRLQTINKAAGEMTYDGVADCFWKIYKYEGVQAFYKGGLCRIMVIAPLFGVAQTVYDFGVGKRVCSALGI